MKAKVKIVAGTCAIAVLVTVSACGSSAKSGSSASTGTTNSSSAFVVGAVEPLSGPYSTIGLDIVHGLEAEAAILNAKGGIEGHQVKIVSADDDSDAQKAISAAQKLLQTNKLNMFEPDVVFGNTELPLAKNLLSVNLCASPDCGDGAKYPLDFSMNPSAKDQVPPLLGYAKKLGDTKVGIIGTDDPSGQSFAQTVSADAATSGISVTKTELFAATATNIDAQIESLKSSGAQVVMAWADGTTITTVMDGMQSVGWTAPVLGTPTIFTGPVGSLVPAAVSNQLVCLCYSVGIRSSSTIPPAIAPLVDKAKTFGTINSMMVLGLAADTLALANYGYTKAGSLDVKTAASDIDAIGADAAYPGKDFWAYQTANPGFSGTTHSPANAKVNQGFYAVTKVSPLVDGTYIGTPFSY